MATAVAKAGRRWTYDEYRQLEGEQRYEILEGELVMAPAPDTSHQRWSRKLFLKLERHVARHRLGEVFFAPIDVVLDPEVVVQPDLVFVAQEHAAIIQPEGIFGPPDLVVEIVSPGSVRNDRYRKRALYARFGIREYWLCDPANRTLEVLSLKKGDYELLECAVPKGRARSLVLAGFQVAVEDL
jgi:Uma2 family endonuclease